MINSETQLINKNGSMPFRTFCLDPLLKLRYVKSIARLYEQGATVESIGQYILKWLE